MDQSVQQEVRSGIHIQTGQIHTCTNKIHSLVHVCTCALLQMLVKKYNAYDKAVVVTKHIENCQNLFVQACDLKLIT